MSMGGQGDYPQSQKREYLQPEELDALAVVAKGDKDASLRLWDEVERFVDMKTGQLYGRRASSVLDFDDYKQCAYIGFTYALKNFNPEKCHFLTALVYGIRRACHQEYRRLHKEPFGAILSLDAPITKDDGEDGGNLVDFISDEAAEIAFETVVDDSVTQVILDEVSNLRNHDMARIITDCVLGEQTLDTFAIERGVSKQAISQLKKSALKQLRRKPSIRALLK